MLVTAIRDPHADDQTPCDAFPAAALRAADVRRLSTWALSPAAQPSSAAADAAADAAVDEQEPGVPAEIKTVSPRKGSEGYVPKLRKPTSYALFLKHTTVPDELRGRGPGGSIRWLAGEWAKLSDKEKAVWKARAAAEPAVPIKIKKQPRVLKGPEGYAPNPKSNRATNFGLFMKHTAIPDELRGHGCAMALAWFSEEWAKLSDEDKEAWKARAEDADCVKRLEEAKIATKLAELVARMPTRPGRLHGPTLFHRTQECKDLVKSWADEARAAGRKPECTVNLYAKAWSSLSLERQEVFNARARQIKIDFNEALKAFRFSLTDTERALLNGAKVNLQFFKTNAWKFEGVNVTTPWNNFLREYRRAHPPVYDGLVGREVWTANMKFMTDAGKAWQAHKLALRADGPASAPTEAESATGQP